MPAAGGTVRAPRRVSRRWIYAGSAALGLLALVVIALAIVYPRVGAWMIRSRVGDKLATKIGRDVTFGSIKVRLGHAVLSDVDIRGPLDGDTPLVHIDRIDVDFDAWASLLGRVRVGDIVIDGVVVTIRRDADGRDNLHDVLDRLRGDSSDAGDASSGAGGTGLRPARVSVVHARLFANDDLAGATALVGDGDALWTPEGLVAHARGVTASTTAAPKARVQTIDIDKRAGEPPVVAIGGGELELWPRMALSGIDGQISPKPDRAGDYAIDLSGGYGGVPGRLWTATGAFDARALAASLDVEAARFQLERLRPILERTAVVDYQQTSVDTKLHLDVDRAGAKFAGTFHLRGLNVGHPKLADREVRDLDLSGDIAGSFDRASRTLALSRGNFVARDVPFALTGTVVARQHATEQASGEGDDATLSCPPTSKLKTVELHLVIPPIDCQRVLVGIPKEIAPHFAGYRLRGVFTTDIAASVDFDDLDKSTLDGKVAINKCRVVDEPSDSPKRLKDEFEHFVEVEQGRWESFVIGPTNPDYVPLEGISPHLVNSIMSTEDSAFYQHHGFIPSEFRSALVTDLKKCDYAYGASSITMQLVKNVLLSNEKTLGRKLQELFLTWHVENTLTKDRILEIYFNAIEYGPGIYGIGPAARHYFGKSARELNPVEATFFSSILPNPKDRYRQYCQGAPYKWTTAKIERTLALMLKRKRLTQEEYDQAIATPLVFVKDGSESEDDCMKRVKQAIKNARPTNPSKKKKPGSKPGRPAKRPSSTR